MIGGRTKLMIAYDGSEFADAAIDDLPRAGMPDNADVLIVSVADLSVGTPEVSEFDILSAASRRTDAVLGAVRSHQAQMLKETRGIVSKIVHDIRVRFPEWRVHGEVLRGRPVDELLRKSDSWKPDLITGGSQGRSTIGRFFLGSVSRSVAEDAACSVRVVRRGLEKADGEPTEIILCAKHPAEAEQIVDAFIKRSWPDETRVRLVGIEHADPAARVSAFYPDGKSICESAAERLLDAGVTVSVQVESGDPKTILIQAADAWRADAIFVVAGGTINGPKLDETASGLITDAKCTVEIVR